MLYKRWGSKRLHESRIDIIDQMSEEEFERFAVAHLKNLGYKAVVTPHIDYYGADLILEKNGKKWLPRQKDGINPLVPRRYSW